MTESTREVLIPKVDDDLLERFREVNMKCGAGSGHQLMMAAMRAVQEVIAETNRYDFDTWQMVKERYNLPESDRYVVDNVTGELYLKGEDE